MGAVVGQTGCGAQGVVVLAALLEGDDSVASGTRPRRGKTRGEIRVGPMTSMPPDGAVFGPLQMRRTVLKMRRRGQPQRWEKGDWVGS